MLSPFTNVLGEPYVTETVVPTEPFALKYAIRDRTTINGMQPDAIKQLQAAAAAAHAAGLSELRVVAARGGGHKSHFAGTEWDVVGYKKDGTIWTPAERVKVAEGARGAGATRFGLYSFGKGSLGSGTLHFGYGPKGFPDNITWGYAGLTSGPLSRRFTDPAEAAFRDSVSGGKPFDAPDTVLAYAGESVEEDPFSAVLGGSSKPTLRYRNRDESWNRVIQTRLVRANPALGHDFIDGIFGSGTRKAIIGFQKSVGLRPDGVVGPRTWAALDAAFPESTPAPTLSIVAIAAPSSMTEPGNISVRDVAADNLSSYVVNDGDKHAVIPALSPDSRPLTKEAAGEQFKKTNANFGRFDNADSAEEYARSLLATPPPIQPVDSPYAYANSPFAADIGGYFEQGQSGERLSQSGFDARAGSDQRFAKLSVPINTPNALNVSTEVAAIREGRRLRHQRGSTTARRGKGEVVLRAGARRMNLFQKEMQGL